MSIQPHVPANLADLTGDEWQTLADEIHAYEESIMTDAQRAFMKLHAQHAKGLLTDTDLWAETVQIILGTDPDALFPPAPVVTKTLVGHGPTSTYRMTDQEGNFLGFSGRA